MTETINLIVQIGIAVGTVGAVIVALFRDNLRTKFAPPKLSIRLLSPLGYKTEVQLTSRDASGNESSRRELARYYHLRVSNERRWSTANQTQVFLTRIEAPGPDEQMQVVWLGELPMRWRYQESYPVLRTLGPQAEADLCSIVKGKWLQLEPLIRPAEFPGTWRKAIRLILHLEARCVERDSDVLKIEIAWDGEWDDGDLEMQKNLVVKEIS